MKKLVTFVAVAEGLTGIAAMLIPAPVISLVFGVVTSAPMTVLCQTLGAALVGLAFACWPRNGEPETLRRQCRSLTLYSGLVALILLSAALIEQRTILWVMAILHAALTLLLAFQRGVISRSAASIEPL